MAVTNPYGAVIVSIDNATNADLGLAFQGKLEVAIAEQLKDVERAYMGSMQDVVAHGVRDLRADILAGGFTNGAKLSKSWHGQPRPSGTPTLEPAGWFWNKAPDLLDAFADGVTITVKDRKFLAIPLGPAKAIVRRLNQASNRSRNGFGKFAREDDPVARVEAALGIRLVAIIGRSGATGVLIPAKALTLTRTGRVAKHQTGQDAPLFALVKQATLKKRIKGRAMLTEIQDRFPGEFAAGVASRLPEG